jgi:hypothetical protein
VIALALFHVKHTESDHSKAGRTDPVNNAPGDWEGGMMGPIAVDVIKKATCRPSAGLRGGACEQVGEGAGEKEAEPEYGGRGQQAGSGGFEAKVHEVDGDEKRLDGGDEQGSDPSERPEVQIRSEDGDREQDQEDNDDPSVRG